MSVFKLHLMKIAAIGVWEEFVKRVSDIANIPSKYKEEIYHQTKWELVRDTRRRSQVTNNKPKHLIKKIIR